MAKKDHSDAKPSDDRGRRAGAGLSRRGFLVSAAAVSGLRAVPPLVARLRYRRVLTLVYDKAAGAMRAVEKLVPLP